MDKENYDLDDKINLIYDYIYNVNTNGCYKYDKIKLGEISLSDIKYMISNDEMYKLYKDNILNSKFKITSYDNNTNELIIKRYSDQFPVTVKINFYKNVDTINTFENPINNDSLFSYLLSQLVLSGKTKHILLPVINLDVTFSDISTMIGSDGSHDSIYNSIKNNEILDTCCLQVREHFFKTTNLFDYIKENTCILKNLLFQVIHTLATIQLEYYDFRHNNLLLKNIVVYLKKNSDTYVSYDGFNNDKFYLPNAGFDIKISNFEKSIIFKYHGLFNKTDEEHNNYYDLFIFLNDLVNNISSGNSKCDQETKEFLDEILPIKMRDKPLKNNLNLFNPIDLVYHKYFKEYKIKQDIKLEETLINHNYLTGGNLYLNSDNISVLGDQNKISNNIMDKKVNKRTLKKEIGQKGGFDDMKQEKNDSVAYKPERNNPFMTNEQRDINRKRTLENPVKDPPVLLEQTIYDTSKREPPKSQFPPTFVPIYDQTGTATQVVPSYGYPYSQVVNQPPVQKVYNISLSNPVGNYTSINRIYEDVLPSGQFEFSSLTIYERKQLVEFMRNSMIESIDGEEMSISGGSKSLLQYIKFMNVNPYTIHKNPFMTLPKNFLLYRAAYPVRYNEKGNGITLAKPATGVNARIYMLTNGDMKCNVIPSLKLTDGSNTERGLDPQNFDVWRELKYYDMVKTDILKRKVSPNFIAPILYKTDSKSKINWNQFEVIKGNNADAKQISKQLQDNLKQVNKSHNMAKQLGLFAMMLPTESKSTNTIIEDEIKKKQEYIKNREDYTMDSGKLLILLTEAPNSSIMQWCTRIYESQGSVKKMISTGYHTSAVWKSIIFQMVYCCAVLQKKKIHMDSLSLEKNFFIKDIFSDPNAVGSWIYRANNIDYYIPNYGYILMFDSSYADIETKLPLSSIGSIVDNTETNNKKYKINCPDMFDVNNDNNYDIKIYAQFKDIIHPDNFGRKLQLNNGTIPDDDVIALLDKINKSSEKDISKILSECFTEFMHNRCGTSLTVTEKTNISSMVRPNLKKGNLMVHQERSDEYKWCIYIEPTKLNKHIILTNNNGKVDKVEVFQNALFGYPDNEKVQPINKKNMRYDENYIYESYSLDNIN